MVGFAAEYPSSSTTKTPYPSPNHPPSPHSLCLPPYDARGGEREFVGLHFIIEHYNFN